MVVKVFRIQNYDIACMDFSEYITEKFFQAWFKYWSIISSILPPNKLFYCSCFYLKTYFWRKNTLLLDMLPNCYIPLVKFTHNINISFVILWLAFLYLSMANQRIEIKWPGFLHKRLFKKTMKILSVVVLKSGLHEFLV